MTASQLTFTCSKSTTEKTRKRCEICSKLTIKTPERRQCFTPFSTVSIVDFEQVNVSWLLNSQNDKVIHTSSADLKSSFVSCNFRLASCSKCNCRVKFSCSWTQLNTVPRSAANRFACSSYSAFMLVTSVRINAICV